MDPMITQRPHIPMIVNTNAHHPPQQDYSKKLTITQQTCLVEEKFSKNGVQKDVHVVVKNNPFAITLALLDKQFNFHQLTTEIQLVYDCATLKEVDFVKLKPLECKSRPNEEGDQLTVEIRIKVLTSQLEDMFFRVVIKLVDPRTKKEHPQLVCLSHPIRVVSKPDQVKKKIKKRKRAPTDSLLDSISRIECQQREQQRLLKKLCTGKDEDPSPLQDTAAYSSEESPTPEESVEEEKDDFRSAFSDFLTAFKQLQSIDTSDGSYKINTSAQDAQTMCEILELIRAEIKKERQQNHGCEMTDAPCACINCPYKEKMDKISSSFSSAVPDTSISNSCNMPLPIPMSMDPTGVHAPVVCTDAIDGAMGLGGLFDMNMMNSYAQMHHLNNLGAGVGSVSSNGGNGFNFSAFGDFNPLSLFAPPV